MLIETAMKCSLRFRSASPGARLVFGLLLIPGSILAEPSRWTESVFTRKPHVGRPYMTVPLSTTRGVPGVIGTSRQHRVEKGDTFLDVARYYSLGYNELEHANRGVDPWIPPQGSTLRLPTQWVLPEAPYKGIVVNIPEMRIFYFRSSGEATVVVTTYPVGLGRDEWRTPQGKFTVTEKTVNPRWVLTESIKAEHRKEGRPAPDFIAGGAPDNPLGKYRLRLSLPLFGIHGTDIPWGVGMQVSHGCVRLYPEDIEQLFPLIPVGTPGEFVYQPVKVGVRDKRVFLEVHEDIYDHVPGLHREAWRLIDRHGLRRRVDPELVKRVVLDHSGVAEEITWGAEEAETASDASAARRPTADGSRID